MKLGTRNTFVGTITKLVRGPVSTEVTIRGPRRRHRVGDHNPFCQATEVEKGSARTRPHQG